MIENLVTREVLQNSNWRVIHWLGATSDVYVAINKTYMEMAVVVGSMLIKIKDPVIGSYKGKTHVVERDVKRKVEELIKEDWFQERYNMEINL